MKQPIEPTMEYLTSECVLYQAWKKTAKYIRQHNWYSDTLELDFQSLRLPDFIKEIKNALLKCDYKPKKLKVIPAPKSHPWKIENNKWFPEEQDKNLLYTKTRPLAHVNLMDQVIATAMMLCIADKVESEQNDPTLSIFKKSNRNKIVSYGNRLFCDTVENKLLHRWGSSVLYRQYFVDYQTFLKRPEIVYAQNVKNNIGNFSYSIIKTDLNKFFDRVRPEHLISSLDQINHFDVDTKFKSLFSNLFNWGWEDQVWCKEYSENNNINGFDKIALPQGLVAAGFFSNLVLLRFDNYLKRIIKNSKPLKNEIEIIDFCRYVDDFSFVIKYPKKIIQRDEILVIFKEFISSKLEKYAPDLQIAPNKTDLLYSEKESEKYFINQSKTASRIEHEISGPFDMLHGTEIISSIESFFYTQKRFPQQNNDSNIFFNGISDMKDDTAARFAAGKFRKTFRSLRPLLDKESTNQNHPDDFEIEDREQNGATPYLILSKDQLDHKAKVFCQMLIAEWIKDPSNIRLLRIAFDIYPDVNILIKVTDFLKNCWDSSSCQNYEKAIKQYCLSELFRAGATETGLVSDSDYLPDLINPEEYHSHLINIGILIINKANTMGFDNSVIEWFLLQQVLLYLIVRGNIKQLNLSNAYNNNLLKRYVNIIEYIKGDNNFPIIEQCIFTILIKSSFNNSIENNFNLNITFFKNLFYISPSIGLQIWNEHSNKLSDKNRANLQKELGIISKRETLISGKLSEVIIFNPNPFWDEENVIKLLFKVAQHLNSDKEILFPDQIICKFENELFYNDNNTFAKVNEIVIEKQKPRSTKVNTFFSFPEWIENTDSKKKYRLGQIVRYALYGNIDFYNFKRSSSNRKTKYSIPISHWEQIRYGIFNGRTAFAPEWIPISSWLENILIELLRWPGCNRNKPVKKFNEILKEIDFRKNKMDTLKGKATQLLFLEQNAPILAQNKNKNYSRKMRICIVQNILPDYSIFEAANNKNDIELNEKNIRIKMRKHIATLIQAVEQMLQVRNTHIDKENGNISQIDLLILPELAIHNEDINSILIPFIRRHRCIILAGLVYHTEHILESKPLINSAIWLIPDISNQNGLNIRRIKQGKFYLTKDELALNPKPQSFRPAQWIINYYWKSGFPPLKITASVCYDSTDIKLASDLKNRSDIFIVCALNKDVNTFDKMAESLHYNMFQGVIIVNNGKYGGSNFYMPFKDQHYRQVLHLHGQPQAQIAFVEIDPFKLICKGGKKGCTYNKEHHYDIQNESCNCQLVPSGSWKTKPAGDY